VLLVEIRQLPWIWKDFLLFLGGDAFGFCNKGEEASFERDGGVGESLGCWGVVEGVGTVRAWRECKLVWVISANSDNRLSE
jgi:hypothetical protein